MLENSIKLVVPEEFHLERIDKFITVVIEVDFSRSYIQKLIKNGNILVNGEPTRANYKVKTDDEIEINIPEPTVLEVDAEDIPLNIVYEDDHIAVINKQPGLVIHPGPGNWSGTMVNGLLFHLKKLSAIGGVIRPGIVHRLDKDTTGLVVVAKSDEAHKNLVEQFANRKVKKKYSTIVVGNFKNPTGLIDKAIGRHKKYRHKMTVTESGKEARTEYKVVKVYRTFMGVFSLLDINLLTGRTHQIRVHMSSLGNPIVGDPIYSKKWEKYRVPYLLLVSRELTIEHPISGEEMTFSCDMPSHILDFIKKLEGQKLA